MLIAKIIFWLFLFIAIYTYIGYPLLLVFVSFFKNRKRNLITNYEPTVTLFVTAYNEQDYVDDKIKNSLELDYPKNKLELVWVTDGSDDNTNKLLEKYPEVKVYFKPERNGKINAMNRGMQFVNSEIVIFSDGNTLLSKDTVKEMVKTFQDEEVGCIAGEKRISLSEKDNAASSGEGLYWKYESWIKNMDAKVGSCVGAAGELFSIRKNLFFNVPEDTLLDDFIISLTIAGNGYRVDYNPKAYAIEKASANIAEEMKRKIRIAAGSIQSIGRLKQLLNVFKYGFLSIQYISHKILRWVVVPVGLVLIIISNALIVFDQFNAITIYHVALYLQLFFYLLVAIGHLIKNKKIGISLLFVPYYFFMGNLAMYIGFLRYKKGKQSVNWERAKRAL